MEVTRKETPELFLPFKQKTMQTTTRIGSHTSPLKPLLGEEYIIHMPTKEWEIRKKNPNKLKKKTTTHPK